jgi:hypothetical protein
MRHSVWAEEVVHAVGVVGSLAFLMSDPSRMPGENFWVAYSRLTWRSCDSRPGPKVQLRRLKA